MSSPDRRHHGASTTDEGLRHGSPLLHRAEPPAAALEVTSPRTSPMPRPPAMSAARHPDRAVGRVDGRALWRGVAMGRARLGHHPQCRQPGPERGAPHRIGRRRAPTRWSRA
jgi:hypothetical protein